MFIEHYPGMLQFKMPLTHSLLCQTKKGDNIRHTKKKLNKKNSNLHHLFPLSMTEELPRKICLRIPQRQTLQLQEKEM